MVGSSIYFTGTGMSIPEIIIVFLLPLSGVHIGLLVFLIVKTTRVETLLTTHAVRLDKLEETVQ